MPCKSVSGYCFNVGFMQDDSSDIEDTFFILLKKDVIHAGCLEILSNVICKVVFI